MSKKMYEAPDVEMFEVQVEKGFATSKETGGSTGGDWGVTDSSGSEDDSK